jgi:F-type H+-transporting ATPase subunit b
MNRLIAILAEDPSQSKSWIWPEQAELIYGSLASVIVIGLLWWKAGPLIKKFYADRTARIQGELDFAADARAKADADAVRIREAKGDIESERARILATADEQAAAVLADGRVRLDAELTEVEARAMADIEGGKARATGELHAEIARLSAAAVDRAVVSSLDDATQQTLIEEFIQKVGASA